MGTRPRIAVLNSSFGIAQRGGERVLLEVSEYLSVSADVHRFTGGSLPGISSTEIRPITRDRWLAKSITSLTPARFQRWCRRLHLEPLDIERMTFNLRVLPRLLGGEYDLIITQADFWTCLVCRLARRLTGTPFITVSGGLSMSSREALRHGPDAHVVVNPQVELDMIQEFPDALIRYIPNGVDLDQFTPGAPSTDLGLNLERPIFLTVGACEPRKRIDLTVRAISSLPTGSLLMLGDGPLREEWETLGNDLLGDRRFERRYVPLNQIADYYRACDVFTLPSLNEPFGLVYLEAMACNRPVVAEDDIVRRMIIGDGGTVCRCEDVEAYARALQETAQSPHGDKPLLQARRFSWSEIGKQYESLVQHVIETPR